jgi:hypothetical protein
MFSQYSSVFINDVHKVCIALNDNDDNELEYITGVIMYLIRESNGNLPGKYAK